ncbi:uncharacterized protein DUF938 [Thioalkalivibrio sp. ALE21]|uniref:DUF938 domain-containing protein n=1 Tax=Thioalkalivibrio sp. ALE21 TaxID=1158175 RepID=UPI000D861534|nr:DUF938 domain-containing protein [Thioalkalivibrio sp. ALE21]PYG02901.1 uncharacterized protein DUF938 [Thioalkalivibrio sp. ALE21]
MEVTQRPYAPAAEQNREPILGILEQWFIRPGALLELGAGTGQHAAFMAPRLGHLQWLPTDVAEHLPGIEAWRREAAAPNLQPPRALDVAADPWPDGPFRYVYSANTVHILHWPGVEALFSGVAGVLEPDGLFALYGPFAHDGEHTAESNARFDRSLRQQDPGMGVRDRADLDALASACGLTREAVVDMPVNNQILIWRRDTV